MRYVVVGAGVAGTSCARVLAERAQPGDSVTLVAAGDALKCVEAVERVTRRVEIFDVVERPLSALRGVQVLQAHVRAVDSAMRFLSCDAAGRLLVLPYDRLCVASGAVPRHLPLAAGSPGVLTLRDTDSVATLGAHLAGARRLLLVGNGGIALELVDALASLPHLEVVWAVRHKEIGDAFFDTDSARFLQTVLAARCCVVAKGHGAVQAPGSSGGTIPVASPLGAAVGPNWVAGLLAGAPAGGSGRLRLELQSMLEALERGSQDWPLRATLSTGLALEVDCVISATGVEPAVGWAPSAWARGADGGLLVDQRCAVVGAPSGVYAAGDAACCAGWEQPHWHQMRLWAQAKALGELAGTAMAEEDMADGTWADNTSVDLFVHCTRFLGLRVVLLGRYNGQGLEAEEQHLISYCHAAPPGLEGIDAEFVRVLLLRGRVRGVVLIGDNACSLADTFERLILSENDVAFLGPRIVDPELDLEGVHHEAAHPPARH